MRLASVALLSLAAFVAGVLPANATPRAHRGPTAPKLFGNRSSKTTAKPQTHHEIDSSRATELQSALIKAGYLNGTTTGVWDASTEAAMQRLQADNGWQTKIVPDARAIIKLGLGPNTAATSIPPESAAPSETSSEKPTFSQQ